LSTVLATADDGQNTISGMPRMARTTCSPTYWENRGMNQGAATKPSAGLVLQSTVVKMAPRRIIGKVSFHGDNVDGIQVNEYLTDTFKIARGFSKGMTVLSGYEIITDNYVYVGINLHSGGSMVIWPGSKVTFYP
jgi:hypothetical protein